jgi:hypothetical protein
MGDVADAMLEGDLCQCCGEYMEGGAGYPQTCAACSGHTEREFRQAVKALPKVACPTCGKVVKVAGLQDHIRDKHSTAQKP